MPTTIYPDKNISPTQPRCSCIICKKEYSVKGIHSHYLTAHTKEGNDRVRISGAMGEISPKKIEFDRYKLESNKQEYYKSPNHCLQCSLVLSYEKRINAFCSKSCSASSNNTGRSNTQETNLQISASLKARAKELNPPYTKISFVVCEICNEHYRWDSVHKGSKRFCSKKCLNNHLSQKSRTNTRVGVIRSSDEIALYELCSAHFNHVTANERIFDGWDADILIYDTKTAILWDGPWHYKEMNIGKHSLKQTQNRDSLKIKIIQKAGWDVITFEDRYYTPQLAFDVLLDVL